MVTPSLRRAVASLDGPFAVIDADALDRNASALRARAGGLPIRVASKSIRVTAALRRVLEQTGYAGILAFSLREALALAARGFDDIVVAYPSVDRTALAQLAADPEACAAITLMVDCSAHLDIIDAAVRGAAGTSADSNPAPAAAPIRVCIDLDASLRPAEALTRDALHIGPRRSPLRQVDEVLSFVAQVQARDTIRLVGLMCYEGQIAGQANAGASLKQLVLRRLQASSAAELKARRSAVVAAVREVADLEFVNGGGTGSLELSAAEGSLTELAAGSGLLSPGLFDGYVGFRHEPAAFFACPVVRLPAPGWATVFEGGWIASGPPGRDRLPTIDWPANVEYAATEGAGEVQTPLHGPGTAGLAVGDNVFFRHAKSGELAEHFDEYHVVAAGELVDTWTTYRGEGWTF